MASKERLELDKSKADEQLKGELTITEDKTKRRIKLVSKKWSLKNKLLNLRKNSCCTATLKK
jgi:hypothetical protein